MSELLTAAAAALDVPEPLIQRSAAARATANGSTVDEVLAAWGGGAPMPAAAPAAEPAPVAAVVEEAEPAEAPSAEIPVAAAVTDAPAVAAPPAPAEPVVQLEPVSIRRRVRTGIRVGAWTGSVLGLVGFLVATTWWAGNATVTGEGPFTPVIQANSNLVVIGVAIVSILFGAIIAGFTRAAVAWTNPAMQLSGSPSGTAWLGALVGLVLGVIAGALLTSGFGTPVEGVEGMVQLPVLPTFAIMLIGGAVLGGLTAAVTQAVGIPVTVAGDQPEIDEVRGRLGGALSIPLLGLLILVLLVLPFAFALIESHHVAAEASVLIATLVAAGILGFASLAGSKPHVRIGFGEAMVAIVGIATVLIVILAVLNARGGGGGEEEESGGNEAARILVIG